MDSEIDKTIGSIMKRNSAMEFYRKLGRFFLILPCVKICTCKSRFCPSKDQVEFLNLES